jgi:hypothetical protein
MKDKKENERKRRRRRFLFLILPEIVPIVQISSTLTYRLGIKPHLKHVFSHEWSKIYV